jgi:hypothetical protein
MAQYIAFEPNVEVTGRTILSTIDGLGDQALEAFRQRGVNKIDPDGWYPQQIWLDVLKEMDQRGFFNMVAVGMKIPEDAAFPPDINTVESALESIDVAYHMNHRGGEIGHYRYEKIGDRHVRMVCDNPYPSDFDYGLIYAMTRRYAGHRADFTVTRADSPCRRKGDDRCIYDIKW